MVNHFVIKLLLFRPKSHFTQPLTRRRRIFSSTQTVSGIRHLDRVVHPEKWSTDKQFAKGELNHITLITNQNDIHVYPNDK